MKGGVMINHFKKKAELFAKIPEGAKGIVVYSDTKGAVFSCSFGDSTQYDDCAFIGLLTIANTIGIYESLREAKNPKVQKEGETENKPED